MAALDLTGRRFDRATETLAKRVADARQAADAAAGISYLGPAFTQAAAGLQTTADTLFAALVSVLRVDAMDSRKAVTFELADAYGDRRAEELVAAAAQKQHKEAAVKA